MHYFVSWTLEKWIIDHVPLYDILSNIWRMFSQDWTFVLPPIFLYTIVWILLEMWCPKLIPGHEMGSHQYRIIQNYALNIISWCSSNIFIYLFQLYHKGKKKSQSCWTRWNGQYTLLNYIQDWISHSIILNSSSWVSSCK